MKVRQYNSTLSRTVYMWGDMEVKAHHKKRGLRHSHASLRKNLSGKIRKGPRKKAERRPRRRDHEWRVWQFRCLSAWLDSNGTQNSITCLRCGALSYLQADHVMPRSNRLHGDPWHPCNGQILCLPHNMEKGSRHGPQWDFRSKGFKEFQQKKAEAEWEYNVVTRAWSLKKQFISYAKTAEPSSQSQELYIPDSLLRENFKTPSASVPNVP